MNSSTPSRDRFAFAALTAMLDARFIKYSPDDKDDASNLIGELAYKLADGMLKARGTVQNHDEALSGEIFMREQAEKRAQMAEYAVKNLTAANEDYKRIVAELRAKIEQQEASVAFQLSRQPGPAN